MCDSCEKLLNVHDETRVAIVDNSLIRQTYERHCYKAAALLKKCSHEPQTTGVTVTTTVILFFLKQRQIKTQ